MTKTGITYGSALYDLAVEESITADVFEQMKFVRSLFVENPDYLRLLKEPSVDKEERKHLLHEALQEGIHPYLLNFLKLLIDNDTLSHFGDCLEEYKQRYYADNSLIEVEVISAAEISAEQKEKLLHKLENKTQKKVIMTCSVDPSLLGGVRIRMQDREFDGTVRHHLEEIQKLLKSAI